MFFARFPGERTRPRELWPVLFALLLVSITPRALAQYQSDLYSGVSLGVGGAYRAIATDASAIDLNPAGMTASRVYRIQTDYRLYTGSGSHMARVAFLDNITSRLATGVSWSWDWTSELTGSARTGWVVVGESPYQTRAYRAQDYKLAFALPLGSYFSLGTTLDWHRYKLAETNNLDETKYTSKFTFDAAVQFRPSPVWNLVLVGNNLVPTKQVNLPTTVAAAVAASAGQYLVADVDLILNFTGRRDLNREASVTTENMTLSVNAGLQALLGRYFPVRVGFYTEQVTRSRYMTGGVGIDAGQIALNYGVRYQLSGDGYEDLTLGARFYHLFSLALAFGPGGQGR